jgi:hypothetical protein
MNLSEISIATFITEISSFCAAKSAQNLELMEKQFLILKKISQKIMIEEVLDKTIHNFSEEEIQELKNEYGKEVSEQPSIQPAHSETKFVNLDQLEIMYERLIANEAEFLRIKADHLNADISHSDFLKLLSDQIQKIKNNS